MDSTRAKASSETTEQSLDRMRLRLVDAAFDLRPLPTKEGIGERVRAVASELHKIERELLLLCHVDSKLGDTQLTQKLEDLDIRIAEGWRPEAADADEFVAGLRQQFPS
ncbi:MAG TPA: hypothetical protein VM142_04655 [Acidimicrobiales bacterium]|nr:hypothetical protein [Acidimicrobiales bacterium]